MFSQKGLHRHPVNKWNERDVCRWLKKRGLGKLWRNFHDKKVDGKVLLQITSQYLDRLGVSNPTSRDKLLAAVHELKLFGGSIPDERMFRSPRPTRRSLPARPAGMCGILPKEVLSDSVEKGVSERELVERKTPQRVLQEQTEEMLSEPEKGTVQVRTPGLNPDTEITSIEITNQTTSKKLVRLLLEKYNELSKDHNLFYIAVEIEIQKKDSSLPMSQMTVLADDARPLQIQSRQPTREAKFHLKMKSGGLLRVQAGILSPGATYKCVQISRKTRADEVVKMILSSYGSDAPPEKFVLVERLSDPEAGRILEADECPLEVQSRWETGDQGTFTLTQAEFEGVLLSDEKNPSNQQGSSSDNEMNTTSVSDQKTTSSSSETEDKENREEVRKRRTSIDALDLQTVNQIKRKVSQIDNLRHKFQEYHEFHGSHRRTSQSSSNEALVQEPKKRKVSQIDLFRSKFLAYYGGKMEGPGALDPLSEIVKASETAGKNGQKKKSPPSRSPSAEHSDGEELPRFSSSPPPYLRDNNNNNNRHKSNSTKNNDVSLKDFKTVNIRKDSPTETSHLPRLSLATVLQRCKLITVILNREAEESWGIELVHVTKTGSSVSPNDINEKDRDEEKVVYVQHNGPGQNSIINTSCASNVSNQLSEPTSPLSESSSGSSEQEITTILGTNDRSRTVTEKLNEDMRHIVHKQNLHRRIGTIIKPNIFQSPNLSPTSSRPDSASTLRPTNPLPPRPSSALAQWKKEGSPQPRPGVRIVALTEGGVAERSKELAVDDLIVEINGHFVLNSPLEPVIAAMKEADSVSLVVARSKLSEVKPEEEDNKTDYKDDIKALTLQIKNLVTKVGEMQNDLKKKDDKIKTLKKMVKKNSGDGKGKIYESVQVLV